MGCPINTEFLFDCANPPVGGASNFVMLYNYPEWRAMVDAGKVIFGVNGTISDIINAIGIRAYRFDQPDAAALMPSAAKREVAGGITTLDHGVTMAVIGIEQDQKNAVRAMEFTKAVAIIYRKNGTGEVYGGEQGLIPSAFVYGINDPNLGSIISGLVLSTDTETSGENFFPADVFNTDVATTKALIEGLNVVGV